ncbi:hypothetical protein TorRG33x02_139310 [Trema orientale]|uniref:Uncharacterized protein n=1 Tax=Trema orientale TaxID=63057 RepID=A0A2P5EXL6_TREOI|nr:hypothetical protein TorRG33x02_139310 [Trema orientale]
MYSHSVMDYVNQAMKHLENEYRAVLDQTHVIQLELRALNAENKKRDAERREFQKQVLELLNVRQKMSNAEVEFSVLFKSENGEKKENINVIGKIAQGKTRMILLKKESTFKDHSALEIRNITQRISKIVTQSIVIKYLMV